MIVHHRLHWWSRRYGMDRYCGWGWGRGRGWQMGRAKIRNVWRCIVNEVVEYLRSSMMGMILLRKERRGFGGVVDRDRRCRWSRPGCPCSFGRFTPPVTFQPTVQTSLAAIVLVPSLITFLSTTINRSIPPLQDTDEESM